MGNVTFNSDRLFLHKQWKKNIFRLKLGKGSITMMPKPAGGTQLKSYMEFLHSQGVDILVSLLQFDEVNRFGLVSEGSECQGLGIEFINFAIQDHRVPQFFIPFNQLINKLSIDIQQDKNIAIHCLAGIGRTGITAASLLIKQGISVDDALIKLSKIRDLRVPETLEQITWLHQNSEQLQS